MKKFLCFSFILLISFLDGNSYGHFTEKGHVHTLSKTEQLFLNPDCRSTDTCDLKRFTLTTSVYEVWFSDDPKYATYGNGVIMEYETDSVEALEKYAIVQFVKGCVFDSSKNGEGKINRTVSYIVESFRENIPVVYMANYPTGAFVTGTEVKNAALEFKTCIYKASDVPAETRRDDIDFAKPITCFEWQSVYVYDFDKGAFQANWADVPRPEELYMRVKVYLLVIFIILCIALALVTFARLGNFLSQKIATNQ